MKRTLTTLSLTALFAACGSSADRQNDPNVLSPGLVRGQADVGGTDGDTGFGDGSGGVSETEAVFAEGMFAGMFPGLMVAIGNKKDICARLSQYSVPRDSAFLGFGVYNGELKPPEAGVYMPPDGDNTNVLVGQYFKFDENCLAAGENGKTLTAVRGQVELTSVEHGKSATGRFSVVMDEDAEPMVGEFNATYCDAHEILEAGGLAKAACVD